MKKLLLFVLFSMFSFLGAMECDYFMSLSFNTDKNPTEEDYKKEIDTRISNGLRGKQLIKGYGWDHLSLLVRLTYCNYSELIKYLFDQDLTLINNSKPVTKAMQVSVCKSNFEVLRYLIDKGGDVNYGAGCDFALLSHVFISSSHSNSIIKLLLISNVNPNAQDLFGTIALHMSLDPQHAICEIDRKEAIKLLIIGGSDHMVKEYDNSGSGSKHDGKTAIEVATAQGKSELALLIKQLVDKREQLFQAVAHGVDIDFINIDGISRRHVRDVQGNSLLYYALKYQNYSVVNKLLYLWPQLLKQPNFEGELVRIYYPVIMKMVNS